MLAPQEVEELFSLLRSLTERGRSIIFVTHKLNEALRCDRITVLRKGKITLKAEGRDVSVEDLLAAMFTQETVIDKCLASNAHQRKEAVLQVEGICSGDGEYRRRSDLKNVSFDVHAGEILGIAGIAGNGQRSLLDVITGFCPPTKGQVLLRGDDVTRYSSSHPLRKKNMIAYIPEDRHQMGSLCSLPVSENMILGEGHKPIFFPGSIRHQPTIRGFAENLISEYEVKAAGIQVRADSLSGGNLQKVILARELSMDAYLVIASQPSRGLDFRTTEFVHRKLIEKKEQGKAVLLVSYDLDEIIKLSDRIAVMYEGALIDVPCGETNTNKIGRIMAGIHEDITQAESD